ncbi:DUF6160 family protein [Thalassolituus oleivorans]|uniref:DUF6160 family protein n=1 Tax=Thalassolituus oleivorans TaxID=187493 RepID=UPI000BCAF664|nr:DUF6160 family protein [Thalassolituus oleivorans]PCI48568.1 MAG: hypothetical protein COB43_07920 [Oceanospirillales bacterium]
MKFLKKASLAVSIAAVSFAANAELVAMDEATMSAATGQAGIDLNITLEGANAISIGEILYTDTDVADGGSLSLSTVTLGTASGTLTIENTIDITSDGIMKIATGAVSGLQIGVGSVDLVNAAGANSGNLISGLSLSMDLGVSSTTIGKGTYDAGGVFTADSKTLIDSQSSFKITDGSLSALDGQVGVSGITFDNDGQNVEVDTTMWADASGFNIKVNSIAGDLTLGAVTLGGTTDATTGVFTAGPSIGSVGISNIQMAGATITVSGH